MDDGVRVIQVHGLRTAFGFDVVHDGLEFDVRRGEIMGLVGASGAGKSVLLRSIVGLIRPMAGTVEVLGEDVWQSGRDVWDRLRTRWGVLFQDGALFSSLTVAENIQVPLKEHLRLDPLLMDEIAAVKIHMVGLPPDSAPKYPGELSGGMRKRAGLARALALDPEILLLDEPTAGLDPIGAESFDSLIRDLQRALGLSVLLATHDLDTLAAVCDRVAALVDKHAIVGTMASLRAHPHAWLQAYFSGPRGRAVRTS